MSDWSSDVCSSDLSVAHEERTAGVAPELDPGLGASAGELPSIAEQVAQQVAYQAGITGRDQARFDLDRHLSLRFAAAQLRDDLVGHARQVQRNRLDPTAPQPCHLQDRKSTRLNSSH